MKFFNFFINKVLKRDLVLSPLLSFKVVFSMFLCKLLELIRANLILVLNLRKPNIVFFGSRTKVKNISYINFGKYVRIESNCIIDGLGKNGLKLGDNAYIGPFSRVIVSSGLRDLGEGIELCSNVGIGSHSHLGGSGGVFIGKDTIIGPYFSAHPENHIFDDILTPIRKQGTQKNQIVIGSDCWIGAKVTILSGVSIGDGCVIAAGAVVTKDIPSLSIAAGTPAKVIKTRL